MSNIKINDQATQRNHCALLCYKEREKEKLSRLNYNIEASTNTKNIKMLIKRTIHYLLYLLSDQYHQI